MLAPETSDPVVRVQTITGYVLPALPIRRLNQRGEYSSVRLSPLVSRTDVVTCCLLALTRLWTPCVRPARAFAVKPFVLIADATSNEPKLVGIGRPISGAPTFAGVACSCAAGAPLVRRSSERELPAAAAARTAAPSAVHAAKARRASLYHAAVTTCSVMAGKLERSPSEKLLRPLHPRSKGFQQTPVALCSRGAQRTMFVRGLVGAGTGGSLRARVRGFAGADALRVRPRAPDRLAAGGRVCAAAGARSRQGPLRRHDHPGLARCGDPERWPERSAREGSSNRLGTPRTRHSAAKEARARGLQRPLVRRLGRRPPTQRRARVFGRYG